MSAEKSEPSAVAGWLAALASEDWRVREDAVAALKKLPDEVAPVAQSELLRFLIADSDSSVRNAALSTVVAMGKSMLAPLLAALARADTATGKKWLLMASTGIARYTPDVLAKFAGETEHLSVRVAALETLGFAGTVHPVLLAALHDAETLIQLAALESLARLRHVLAKDDLKRLLIDPMLRHSALRFLEWSNPEGAAELWRFACERDQSTTWLAACVSVLLANSRLQGAVLQGGVPPALARDSRWQPLASSSESAEAIALVEDEAGTGAALSFERVRAVVTQHVGLRLTEASWPMAMRRIRERMVACELASLTDYAHYLESEGGGRAELQRLVERLVTQETYFFRELPQLHAFQHEWLPAQRKLAPLGTTVLRRANDSSLEEIKDATQSPLTIWSAGCASGEEAYTLAMLVVASGISSERRVRVFGTDIAEAGLEVARKGVYGARSFRDSPDSEAGFDSALFFEPAEGTRRSVRNDVRSLCTFVQHNLVLGQAPNELKDVDAIFCRNVLIYFSLETRRKVVRMFYQTLRMGGVLFLGHSESLLHISTDFELVHFRGDMAYRKVPPRMNGAR